MALGCRSRTAEPSSPGPLFEDVAQALERLRPITICALAGSVYGGATDLALACDFRLGVQGMEMHMPAGALGMHYYPSGMQRYVSRMGLAAAKKAFLTALPFSAEDLPGTVAKLKSRHIDYELRRLAGGGIWQLFFNDPCGAKVEFDFHKDEAAPLGHAEA